MPVKDLREWIAQTEARGEVKRINGADWQTEIGALTNLYQRQPGLPALLFDEIPGFPKGFRVLSNSVAAMSRIAASLEMPPTSTPMEIVARWRKAMSSVEGIPANVVDTGPVLENVITGDAINVLKFPTPKWHELDGGRYIGTGDMILTKDPDTDWVNSGTYRVMIHDDKHVALMISPGKHGRMIREKYWAKGQPCPVVVVAGQDPLLYMCSGMELPLRHDRVRLCRRHPRQGHRCDQGPHHGPAHPRHRRDRHRGHALPRQLARRRAFR